MEITLLNDDYQFKNNRMSLASKLFWGYKPWRGHCKYNFCLWSKSSLKIGNRFLRHRISPLGRQASKATKPEKWDLSPNSHTDDGQLTRDDNHQKTHTQSLHQQADNHKISFFQGPSWPCPFPTCICEGGPNKWGYSMDDVPWGTCRRRTVGRLCTTPPPLIKLI